MLEIKEKHFEDFFIVPFVVYGEKSLYVSPMKSDLKRFLDEKSNPLFRYFGEGTFFTVYRNGKLKGRITAHIHHKSNKLHGTNRSYFGFFDCADDYEAAKLLLDKAENWGRSHGCQEIAGNFNQTAMQQIGVMTAGFNKAPYSDQIYSPTFISEYLQKSGYTPFFPMDTYEVELNNLDNKRAFSLKHQQLLTRDDIRWRQFNLWSKEKILEDTRQVLNDSFKNNPMFVPLTSAEFLYQAKDLMSIIDPKISYLIYCKNKPVGVIVCIPDLNTFLKDTKSRYRWDTLWHYIKFRFNKSRAVIIFYGVSRSLHNQGFNGAMLLKVTEALKKARYSHLGITWIASDNFPSLRQMTKLSARKLHTLQLFRKSLR